MSKQELVIEIEREQTRLQGFPNKFLKFCFTEQTYL